LDMHPLDHFILEPLRAPLKSVNQLASALEFQLRGCESAMARFDLVRVDQALAIESETPALLRFGKEAIRVVEAIEHTVERADAPRPAGQHDHLKRGGNRLARRIKWQAQIRP